MARFYNKEQNDFAPHYGDIDWRVALIAKLALEDEELPTGALWFDSEDGIDQQCTQETVTIYVNKASDDMDGVLVLDPRDGKRWSFFRSDIGDEVFDHISHTLQDIGAALVMYSLYPQKEVVEAWVAQNTDDDLTGFVPDDWMEI